MNITKTLPLLIIIFIGWNCFGQNDTSDNKYFSIGSKTAGICLGNSNYYNGLRMNLWDKGLNVGDKVSEQINGVNISFSTQSKIANGIQIGGLVSHSQKINGISIASIAHNAEKINGFAASFIMNCDTLNGVFFGFGIGHPNGNIDNTIFNGLAIGVFNDAEKMNGISITLFSSHSKKQKGLSVSILNKSDELRGLQIGLINYAGNNPKLLRWLPFINLHL